MQNKTIELAGTCKAEVCSPKELTEAQAMIEVEKIKARKEIALVALREVSVHGLVEESKEELFIKMVERLQDRLIK